MNQQQTIEALEKALQENPNDTFTRLLLRDALIEAGDCRYELLEVNPVALRLLTFNVNGIHKSMSVSGAGVLDTSRWASVSRSTYGSLNAGYPRTASISRTLSRQRLSHSESDNCPNSRSSNR